MYMLPDNALGDRLNDVKAGIEPRIQINQDKYIQSIIEERLNNKKTEESKYYIILVRVINMIDVLITSILYGYALKGIIVSFTINHWSFLETIGIGFVINSVLFTIIPKLYNFFTKK